jgi:UDPglucose 6-dehydrogenase
MRGASSLVLAARLLAEGAQVSAYDPVAEQEARSLMPELTYCATAADTLAEADAAVLVTEWRELVELDWKQVAEAMRGNVVIDGRNALDPVAVRAAGLIYEGVGRR